MLKLIMLMLLAVVSNGAAAEWVKVYDSSADQGAGNRDIYIDHATSSRSGDMVKMRVLDDVAVFSHSPTP